MDRSDFEDRFTPSNHEINPSSASKRKKVGEETSETLEMDRISELPDSILVHILTLLPDTESAIRTGILSKRWQFLWTSLSVLHFSDWRCKSTMSNFISFVDNTLIHRGHSKLKKLTVNVSSDDDGVSFRSLDTWIRYAVRSNVEELEVHVPAWEDRNRPDYKVPVHLFSNSTLTSLNLRSCVVEPSRQISWKMLKKLSIWEIWLTNEVIQNILLGSPMLESLKFCSFWSDAHINIHSSSLKELILDNIYSDRVDILEVSGPNILSLEIKGFLPVYKAVLHSLPSLVKVCLDFYCIADDPDMENPDMWMEIFDNISHVQELAIGYLAMKVLSSLELDGWSSPLSKRTLLNMNFIHRSYFPGLANLLRSSPFLERLLIYPPPFCSDFNSCYTRRNFLTYQNRSFHCLEKHLKFVKICYLFENDPTQECELGQFLLENASVLEKMVISVGSYDKQSSSESLLRKRLHESERYLSFPRASRKAVVLVEDLKDSYMEWA